MKTINLRGITNPLSEEKLKKVKGGQQAVDTGGGLVNDRIICAASGTATGSITLCTNDVDRAEERAGAGGWWCCNCQEAIAHCGPLM
jgi:hypothetical protein